MRWRSDKRIHARLEAMVNLPKLRVLSDDRLKSHFALTMTSAVHGRPEARRFRDPRGPGILQRVADKLRAQGFSVSDPKPGKACDAAFDVAFPNLRVYAFLVFWPCRGRVECELFTGCRQARWCRVAPELAYDAGSRVCSSIERALRDDPEIKSFACLTWNEAETRLSRLEDK